MPVDVSESGQGGHHSVQLILKSLSFVGPNHLIGEEQPKHRINYTFAESLKGHHIAARP
jgi:hypothetical protein